MENKASNNWSELTAVTCLSVVMITIMKVSSHRDLEALFGLQKINRAQHISLKSSAPHMHLPV